MTQQPKILLEARKGRIVVPATYYHCPVCESDLYTSKREAERHANIPIDTKMLPEGLCFLTRRLWCSSLFTHLNIVENVPPGSFYSHQDVAPDHSLIQYAQLFRLQNTDILSRDNQQRHSRMKME